MSDEYINDSLLEMFLFETTQLIEQLEQSILSSEKESSFTPDAINEIFRIMHTIKGSAAMMMFHSISTLAHSIEDLFYYLREKKPDNVDCSALSDLILDGVDFIKIEVKKIKNNKEADGNSAPLIQTIEEFLSLLKEVNTSNILIKEVANLGDRKQEESIKQEEGTKQDIVTADTYQNTYKAVIYFEEGCEMENIRAFTIIHNLKELTDEVLYIPEDIIENEGSIEVIRREGFQIYLKSDYSNEMMHEYFMKTIFLKELELIQLANDDEFKKLLNKNKPENEESEIQVANIELSNIEIPNIEIPNIEKPNIEIPRKVENVIVEKERMEKEVQSTIQQSTIQQSIISVNVAKLDKLMDLVGEMVIAEAMVIQNPDLNGLELNNFKKAARQLNKITSEMQDMVMSIRMVPLSATFNKMHRIVRDMCKKLDKEVKLQIIGEETEVDKNIIEHISDPLMHLVRNSLDHGIETAKERVSKGKSKAGTITLEGKSAGSDVLIIVKDDGKGLNRDKILQKARENNLLYKNESDMTDKEVFNLILLPGFSTKESITEFSGRGVGMDVVSKNIEAVGGSLSVDSVEDNGTTIILKIPLTLAIIDGMNIKVGNSRYTIPTISIKESFRPKEGDIITDPDGNEMIMVRGQCYHIRRLHELFKVKTNITNIVNGIIIMVELDDKTTCVFADELLGQQQVVVKALPEYIQNFKKIQGLAGCTLLGDGSISLILDVAGMFYL